MTQTTVHSSAIVEDGAILGANVSIGPFCHVGRDVTLHDDVVLKSHVVIEGKTSIGANTVVCAFTALGGPPQHLGCKGEGARLQIGQRNMIREHVTINRGTRDGRGETAVGDDCFIMTGAHIAHDCTVADNVIFANNATLGGHVVVCKGAFLGGLSAIHQNCRIGAYSFIGGCAAVPTDVIPFGSAIGNHAELAGLNIVGMRRRGVARSVIFAVRDAYKMLFDPEKPFSERVADVHEKHKECEEVAQILAFINADTKRPLMAPRK